MKQQGFSLVRNLEIVQSCHCAISRLHNMQSCHCAISRLRSVAMQSRDCAAILCNLEIGTQFRDSENAQHNLEIAQIPKLRGTYIYGTAKCGQYLCKHKHLCMTVDCNPPPFPSSPSPSCPNPPLRPIPQICLGCTC